MGQLFRATVGTHQYFASVRICLVFGAGASLANGVYFHGERMQDQNPPLDTTFFQKVRALDIPVDSDLRRYAEELPTGSPFDPKTPDGRVEEFFRDLFYDFLAEADADTPVVRAYTPSSLSTGESSLRRQTGCARISEQVRGLDASSLRRTKEQTA
jgi:hypothetical protein